MKASERNGKAGEPNPEGNDPFGMSKFSPRRNTVKIVTCLALIILLLAGATVHAAMAGGAADIAIPATALAVAAIMLCILVRVSIRTVEGEIWIRRLGMGDLDYRVEPRGNDEIAKALHALEAVRQTCIRAMQLDRVQQLSEELQAKNGELETTLEELKRTQDRIISQQKLAELGELSAGVAHEMRNPLQFVRNFATSSEMIAAELEKMLEQPEGFDREEAMELAQDLTENMERVVRHSDRANGIVSGMLMLDRGTGGGFRPMELNRLVTEQANLAHHAVQAQEPGFSADITLDLEEDLGEITAVPEDLARVVANLVTNSCQAMAEKAVEAGDHYVPELRASTARTQEGTTITVRDNGMGMTPEVMGRMFNPFFTTRETGRNTGLGLSLSHDIVREHGGSIEVRSEPGEYTEISVLLPPEGERSREGIQTPSG